MENFAALLKHFFKKRFGQFLFETFCKKTHFSEAAERDWREYENIFKLKRQNLNYVGGRKSTRQQCAEKNENLLALFLAGFT